MSERSSKKPRLVGNTSGGFFDGPIEEEDVAKRKLEEASFESDNFTREKMPVRAPCSADNVLSLWSATPFMYFCGKGDFRMCRFLLSKGASASEIDKNYGFCSGMRAAAMCGNLEICQWLHRNGVAVFDGETQTGLTSLGLAIRTTHGSDNSIAIAKWIILNDGLPRDASGEIDDRSMRLNLMPDTKDDAKEVRPQLLSWAESGIDNHESFMTFLSGTLNIPDFSKESFLKHVSFKLGSENAVQEWVENSPVNLLQAVWEDMYSKRRSSLRCFNGKSGILERIAHFYGLTPTKDLRMFRQLAPALRRFIREHPVGSGVSGEEEEEEDYSDY